MDKRERYIVEFHDDFTDVGLLSAFGCEIRHNYTNFKSKASIIISENTIKGLQNHPKIKSLTKVGKGQAESFRNWGWGYSAVNTDRYYSHGFTGQGVKVAVIDTGQASHIALPTPSEWVDFVNGNITPYDDNEHGTFISGIIGARGDQIGNAPDVTLYVAKVLDQDNLGFSDDFIAGIDWAISNNVDIINFSIGMYDDTDTTVADACVVANNAGIIVCASVGNGTQNDFIGKSGATQPARDSSTIGVGSVNSSLIRSSFSNYGSGLDVMAPGEAIISTSNTGNYSQWQGTSFANAFVVAHLACLLEKYNHNRTTAINTMYANLVYVGSSTYYGQGLLTAEEMATSNASMRATTAITESSIEWEIYNLTNPAIDYDSFRLSVNSTNYNWVSTNTTTNTRKTVSGLLSSTSYTAYAYATWNGIEYYIGSSTATTLSGRANNWLWTTANDENGNKIPGADYRMGNNEWNNFTDRINEFLVYKEIGAITFTQASFNGTFTATIFNQAKNAIGGMNATGIVNKVKDDNVLAADFNTLKTKLNEL